MSQAPLRPLHTDELMNRVKLDQIERMTTDELVRSLAPGCRDCLKAKADGTILDGHHRVFVLRRRQVDIDSLPREIIDSAVDGTI